MMIVDNPEVNQEKNLEIIKYLEKFLNSNLPYDYKDFLLKTNGGRPIKIYFIVKTTGKLGTVSYFLGNRKQVYERIQSRLDPFDRRRIPDNMLVIANDPEGDLILLSVKGQDYGKIYYWDHEMETEPADYSNLTLIADSFEEFINSLKSEEEIEGLLRDQR